jgi:hypothetical protein
LFAAVGIARITVGWLNGSSNRRTLSLNDEDHQGSWIAAKRAKGNRDKARQFAVRAPVKVHYRRSRELTWLASRMATKAEICGMLSGPAGPTG